MNPFLPSIMIPSREERVLKNFHTAMHHVCLSSTVLMDVDEQYSGLVAPTNQGPKSVFVQRVKLNGARFDRTYFTHAGIMAGGTLEFEMSAKPPKQQR